MRQRERRAFFKEASAGVDRIRKRPRMRPSLQIGALTVPKKYAAGLEISCPGGACLKLGR